MSGICGWMGEPRAPSGKEETLAAMAAELGRFGAGEPCKRAAALGAVVANGERRSAGVALEEGVLVAVAGHPRFRDERLSSIARGSGTAAALAAGFRRTGAGLFTDLLGAFAVAIVDERSATCTLAVDRMGIHPLRFCALESTLVFGSTSGALRRHPSIRADIDLQALYEYVYFHAIAGPRTVFRGVQRLMPGQYVTYAAGRCKVEHYWRMRFDEHASEGFEALKSKLRSSMRHGVEHALNDHELGAFLSGGTDSSTVAGLLCEARGEPARTYSIGFDAAGYDEIEYARIAARHFKTRHREYYVTADDIVSAAPSIAAIHDEPFGNSSAVPAYFCAKLARDDGVTRLLAGDGGDELFGGNERYAKQYVFSLYERVPRALRSAVIGPLLGNSACLDVVPLWRKARSYVEQASVPMPARLQTYNLVDRLGAQRIFAPDFLTAVETQAPLRHLEAIYHGAEANSLINRMLALDLQITLADNDLPKVMKSCELAGVDVAFPLLDEEVVDFSARLPPRLKLKGTRLRYFFKEALRGFLPDATIAKKKHGFGLPFGPWLDTNRSLKSLAYDNLRDLRKRGIVRPEFLDELTGQRVQEHASYYGSLVWVFMMLELWFKTQHRYT